MNSFFLAFVGLFVALDILGTLPTYIQTTRGLTDTVRAKITRTSMIVAFVVAVLFMVGGRALFKSLGIQLADFRIAGGIILLLISLADLIGGPEVMKKTSGSTGIVPLAVPLISGPGVLTTLLFQLGEYGYVVTLSSLGLNYAIAWFVLSQSERVTRLIGKDGTTVLSKIAALLLAAIAVAMIRIGIFDSISDWQKLKP
ncbi:MAG: MarC family protein [Bdellovibrionales bacterium]|nr:MarC family protein [Bdellovibrionales bacterium]